MKDVSEDINSTESHGKQLEPNSIENGGRHLEQLEPKIKHQTSYFESLIHLFKAGLGPGCFAMGAAFANVGIVLGIVLTFVMAVICLYEQHVLLKCANNVRRHYNLAERPDYAKTFEMALKANDKWKGHSVAMKRTVNIFLILTQLGFCSVYIVFIGTNVQYVMEYFGFYFSVRIVMLFSLLPTLLPSLITNLKFLAPFSGIAAVGMLVGIGITFYYIFEDGLPSISEREMAIFSWSKMSLFFGTVIYLFEGIGLVLPLKNSMKNPSNFSRPLGVLNVGVGLHIILFISIGLFGYWSFGEKTEGSLTQNLPNDELLAQSVLLILSISVLLGYPMQFFIPIQIMFPSVRNIIKPADRHPFIGELSFRTFMVLVTFCVALVVPNLGLLISLIGAVCSNSLALLFPVMIEFLVVTRDNKPMTGAFMAKNGCILLLFIVGFVSGGYVSISLIIDLYT